LKTNYEKGDKATLGKLRSSFIKGYVEAFSNLSKDQKENLEKNITTYNGGFLD